MATQVKISVHPDLAASFKAACTASNVSLTGKLSEFMAEYSNFLMKGKPFPDYTTKRKRRAAIKSIIKQLEQLRNFEERSRDNIPENLQGSELYENADQCVSWLEEAIEILASI